MTGKVAVVTGGSRGIGRAIVQTLAEAGADVVIASRKLDACEAAAEQVKASTGRQAVAIACHVGRWGDCDRLIAETLARTGRLDVLVNNAGMSPLYDSLDAVSEELFDKTLAVNLKGPFRLAVLAATHMAAHDGGLHHQHRHHRVPDGQRRRTPVRLRQGGPERAHRGTGRGLCPQGAGQRDSARPVPHRHQQGVGAARGRRGPVRAAGADGGSGGAGAAGAAPGQRGVELHDRGDHPRGRRRHPQGFTGHGVSVGSASATISCVREWTSSLR